MQKTLLSTTALLIAAGMAVPAFAQFTLSAGIQSTELQVNTETRWPELFTSIGGAVGSYEDVASNENIGPGGELALGYQFNFNRTYNVALEVFGQLVGTQTEIPILSGLSSPAFDAVMLSNEAVASFDWVAGLRLRPGYNITQTTRLFVDGGIVWGGFEVEYDDAAQLDAGGPPINLPHYTDSETLTGWRYGAGVEHKFGDNFVVGLDYTVTQFEDYTSDAIEDLVEFVDEPELAGLNTEYTPTLHTLGLNFKLLFGAKKQKRQYQMVDK